MKNYGVSHESGPLRRVLLHHPGRELELANRDPQAHHFDQAVDVKRFAEDHWKLVEALREAGVEVLLVRELVGGNPEALEQSYKAPNLVFTRDSSSMTNEGAMLFRMGLPSRRAETPVIKAAYQALDIPVALEMEAPHTFEGGGLALLEGGAAVAGLCERATQGALDLLAGFLLGRRLVDLFIQLNMPPGAIHIDGEFCELPGRVAVVHPQVLEGVEAVFQTRGERWVGSFPDWLRETGWDIIEITDEECWNMAANFLVVDRDLAFHYTGNPRVMAECQDRGIDVVQIPGDEMRKGMGGIHCMTCPILRV